MLPCDIKWIEYIWSVPIFSYYKHFRFPGLQILQHSIPMMQYKWWIYAGLLSIVLHKCQWQRKVIDTNAHNSHLECSKCMVNRKNVCVLSRHPKTTIGNMILNVVTTLEMYLILHFLSILYIILVNNFLLYALISHMIPKFCNVVEIKTINVLFVHISLVKKGRNELTSF